MLNASEQPSHPFFTDLNDVQTKTDKFIMLANRLQAPNFATDLKDEEGLLFYEEVRDIELHLQLLSQYEPYLNALTESEKKKQNVKTAAKGLGAIRRTELKEKYNELLAKHRPRDIPSMTHPFLEDLKGIKHPETRYKMIANRILKFRFVTPLTAEAQQEADLCLELLDKVNAAWGSLWDNQQARNKNIEIDATRRAELKQKFEALLPSKISSEAKDSPVVTATTGASELKPAQVDAKAEPKVPVTTVTTGNNNAGTIATTDEKDVNAANLFSNVSPPPGLSKSTTSSAAVNVKGAAGEMKPQSVDLPSASNISATTTIPPAHLKAEDKDGTIPSVIDAKLTVTTMPSADQPPSPEALIVRIKELHALLHPKFKDLTADSIAEKTKLIAEYEAKLAAYEKLGLTSDQDPLKDVRFTESQLQTKKSSLVLPKTKPKPPTTLAGVGSSSNLSTTAANIPTTSANHATNPNNPLPSVVPPLVPPLATNASTSTTSAVSGNDSSKVEQQKPLSAKIKSTTDNSTKTKEANKTQTKSPSKAAQASTSLDATWVLNLMCSDAMVSGEAVVLAIGVVALCLAGFFPAVLAGAATDLLIGGTVVAAVGLVSLASSFSCRFFKIEPPKKAEEKPQAQKEQTQTNNGNEGATPNPTTK